MPVNQNALLRYRILNDCFRRRNRRWYLEDLIGEVARRLVDHTGKNTISARTINGDIAAMKPGGKSDYDAPIVCDRSEGRGFYYYSDPEYSIDNSPLTSEDADVVRQVLAVLAPFRGLPLLADLEDVAHRLETRTGAASTAGQTPTLHFDTVPNYTGARWLGPLYEALRAREVIRFAYQPFEQEARATTVHPYLLKQYNHRWFLLGQCADQQRLQTYALDRIQGERIERLPNAEFWPNTLLDPATYFTAVIGASVPDGEPQEIRLRFSPTRAPYVLTKPLHPSQQAGATTEAGTEITLHVGLNRELTSLLLSFGADLEVLTPAELRDQLAQISRLMMSLYN